MKKYKIEEISEKLLGQLFKGAFLTVKDNDGNLNTMTISWGTIGCMWRKPVFMAMVRKSRHTFDILEKTNEFTVSFPLEDNLKKELNVCGTKSGREIDKFKECKLTSLESQTIKTPVIKECNLHLECKIMYKQALSPEFMTDELIELYGKGKDYHTLYYGEIKECYVTD